MSDCDHIWLEPSILNADDPTLAYCRSCACVVRFKDGKWQPESVPGQITKATYRR